MALALAAMALTQQGPSLAADRKTSAMLVEGFLRAFALEDLAAVQSYLTDDAVLRMQAAPEAPMILRGRAAASAYFGAVFQRYAAIEIADVVMTPGTDGETVVVEAEETYRLLNGDAHSVAYVWVVSVAHGKIAASRNYMLPLPAKVAQP